MSSTPSIRPANSSSSWCRRATSRSGSGPPGRVSAASSRQPASAPTSPKGKETRHIDGRDYVLEYPIKADFALVKALKADRWGNLVYRMTARNFGPIMASAARCAVVQVDEVVPLGALDPECIVTPGIHVQRVVRVATARRLPPRRTAWSATPPAMPPASAGPRPAAHGPDVAHATGG